jgi:CBS domain-containing protein
MKTSEGTTMVSDFMETEIKSVAPDESIFDAVTTLADGHVHALPVLGPGSRFVGVISTTDILEAISETGSGADREMIFRNTLVRELMTPVPATISPTDSLKEASQKMLSQDIHRLFVTVEHRLVGVISQTDIVRAHAIGRIGRVEK